MSRDLQLDSLLNALRAAGLRAGISEILRLRQVFASQPGWAGGEVPRERLKSLLRAVLVKSAEDRGTFDRVCDSWLDRAEEALEMRRERPQPVLAPTRDRRRETPSPRQAIHLRRAAMAAALMILLIAIDKDARVQTRDAGKLETPAEPSKLGTPVVPPTTVPKQSPPPVATTLPKVTASSTANRWRALLRPEIGLAAFAWLSAGGLWLALLRRRLLPEPEPLAPAAGPLRAFPLSVAPAGAVLLAPRDQEGLAWGIGRFVAEEPTRRLDLTATVRATALAGGWPEMRFYKARFYREVWLWVDEEAEDPALPLLAKEIEAVLAAHGLPVERAAFRGVPHRLVTAAGQVFAPNEIDERRDAALVAVLTDGRRLTRRYTADDQRVRIDALLRSLSHWPHLAFVDASREGGELAAILERHGIKTVAPEQAVAFLAGAVASRSSSRPNREGEAAWAAVCALCPAPVEEATALELRFRLGLAASPYSLQALRTEAPGPPGRLSWRAVDRIRRVSWLREAEVHREGKVTPGSLLARALDFWERVYELSIAGEGASAERFLRMERALLGLWRKPADHIAELYRLYQGPLREIIGQHFQTLAPADWGGTGLIHFPWTWSERAPVERAMLQEMQLGGDMPPVGLRRPGRAWLGIGLLVGLGLAAVGMGTFQSPQRSIGVKTTCPKSEIEENGFIFVRICSGTFPMGSGDGGPQAHADEQPVHQVELAEFWMNKFEVTNEQYREVHPDHEGEEPSLPVMVTWTQAHNFCKRLGYRLPTEAQWEYAARAGTETQWSFGSDEGALSRFAWANESVRGDPHPVGLKGPNPWGLHDMHGNVWEWVEDWYGLYSKEAQVNPTGPSGGPGRVVRGGSFDEGARNLRSAARAWSQSENPLRSVGFRCVRDPRRQP